MKSETASESTKPEFVGINNIYSGLTSISPSEYIDLYIRDHDGMPGFVHISFVIKGKLHELHRQRAETLAHTVRRVMVSALKTLTQVKRDRSKISQSIPEASVVVFSPEGSAVDAMSICNDDWVDGMSFVVKDVKFIAVVAPPEVSELSCFPMRFIMAGHPIIAYASTRRCNRLSFRWECERPDGSIFTVGFGPYLIPSGDTIGCNLRLRCTPFQDVEDGCGDSAGQSQICRSRVKRGRSVLFYTRGAVVPRLDLPDSVKLRATSTLSTSADREALRGAIAATNEHPPLPSSAMENNAAKDPFRVMTYNLLSEMYTSNEVQTKAAYSYLSDMKFLDIGYRAQRIVDEIRVSATDVLCLQEVDLKLFHRYLEPYLCYHGSVLVVPPAKNPSSPEEEGSVIGAIDADGAYQAMGPSTSGHYYGRYTNKNSGTMEGCAIFVNMNRFRVVYELDVPLGLAVLSDPQLEDLIQRRPSLMDILGARVGTIAQIVVLQDLKALNEVIVVANSHFYYHPSANHIRLMHMKAVVDIIAEIRAIILNEQRSLSAADYLYQFDSLLDYTPRYMKSTSYLLSTFAQDAVCRFHGFQESVVAPSLHLSVPLGDAGFDDKLREQSRSPRWHACPGSRVSILLVGDLNSRPKTPALEFLDSGVIVSTHDVWRGLQEFEWLPRGNIQGNRANESKNKRPEQASDDDLARSLKEVAIDPQTAPTISSSTSKIPDLRHAMQLKSAVDNGCILNNRPETYSYYTNYTTDFKDILDYIYFDATTMEVLRVHPFPPEAELRRDTAIPSEVFPSDHVAVVVDLNYRGTPQDCV